jgi:hypothetical protein
MKPLDPPPERTRQPAWLLEAIAVGNRFHFRGRNPWLHNLLNVGLAFALVALISGVLAAAPRVPWAVYLPLAGFALGVLLFSLIILVVHEASHGMFVVSRVRARAATWNRVAGWLVSVPFAINYARWVGSSREAIASSAARRPTRCGVARARIVSTSAGLVIA